MHSGEADQLILASGGSEHAYIVSFSVAISQGSKMDFSLHANLAGFCSMIYGHIQAGAYKLDTWLVHNWC